MTWENSVTAKGVTTSTEEVDQSPAAAEMTFREIVKDVGVESTRLDYKMKRYFSLIKSVYADSTLWF